MLLKSLNYKSYKPSLHFIFPFGSRFLGKVNQASAPVNTEDGQAHVSEHAQLDRLLDIVQKLGEDFSDSQLAVRLIVIRRLVRCGRYTLTVYLDPARRKAVLQLQPSVQQFQNYQLHLQLGRHAAKCSQIHLLRVLLEDRGFKKSIHDLNSYQSELFDAGLFLGMIFNYYGLIPCTIPRKHKEFNCCGALSLSQELGIYPENVAEQDQGQQQSQPAFILDDLRNEEPISLPVCYTGTLSALSLKSFCNVTCLQVPRRIEQSSI